MSLAGAFAGIAARFSDAIGSPYHAAIVHTASAPVLDDGGSIVTPGAPVERDCLCQVDVASERMRAQVGYADKDVALLVIGLTGELDTSARIEVTAGPGAGLYTVQSAERDPGGVGWAARGRPA
jgi:hypothetical protein